MPGVDETEQPITLEDVTVAFGDHVVLDRLTLSISARQTTVIVGRSGSGKTVLLKTMLGLVRPSRGTVRLFGRDIARVSEVELVQLRRRVGMLFQNYALFDALSVEENVEFPLDEAQHAPKREARQVAGEILHLLDLDGNEQLLPAELSGGMRKRVGLARALVGHPDLVLFDEPTTGLDPLMVERVDEMIARARSELGITAVIISHDLATVKRIADRVAFLDGGRILFEGTTRDFFATQLPQIRAMLDVARPRIGAPAPPSTSPPVLQMIDVHRAFGDKQVLRGIDLAIEPHRITVLLGASGSGKSVIAKHLMGLLRPDRGRVIAFGTDVSSLSERELVAIRRRFGLVFQHAALLDWLSVADNVAFPLREHGVIRRDLDEHVAQVLAQLDLSAVANRLPGELSAGERKRVALARALVERPDVVIYDEPTTGQDPIRAAEIDALIQHAQQQFGITSLVISHDIASSLRIAHRIAMLHDGKVVAFGTPAELLASPDPYVQRFLHAASG